MTTDTSAEGSDLATHEISYHRFMLGMKWIAIHLAAVLVFLIVAFATGEGIILGLVAGAVVFALGVYAMRHGLAHSTESDNPGGS
jgi:hypothetical protein